MKQTTRNSIVKLNGNYVRVTEVNGDNCKGELILNKDCTDNMTITTDFNISDLKQTK